ncbi:MAG TPA: alpha/beta hydrolase [Thermoleophilaceae bacterium]|nr:alpha/beta hydrolase [Thermoleophilaceae bacterium]
MATVGDQRGTVDGIATRWLQADTDGTHAPALYVHGVPTAAWLWRDFLARSGGYAPDLPGFGASDKLASFDYSIPGYARWLRAFADQRGLDRFSLVVHDWGGGIGLALAQAIPERIERLAIVSSVPLLPGYRWHRVARNWRRPLIGELAMGFTFKVALGRVLDGSNREPLPGGFVDAVWEHFDHGTQRAILKLYRSAPSDVLAAAGANLGALRCPAIVVYGGRDPYLPAEFAQRYADALGGPATARVIEDAGHWTWLDEPSLIDEIAAFLSA